MIGLERIILTAAKITTTTAAAAVTTAAVGTAIAVHGVQRTWRLGRAVLKQILGCVLVMQLGIKLRHIGRGERLHWRSR